MSVSRQNLLYEYLSENTCMGRTAKIDAILDYYTAVDDEVEIRTVYRDLHALDARENIAIHYDAKTRGYWLEHTDYTSNELRLIVAGMYKDKAEK